MITDCLHHPKRRVAGKTLTICEDCRRKNLRDFYSGPWPVNPAPQSPPSYVTHNRRDCCAYHVGIRSRGGTDD